MNISHNFVIQAPRSSLDHLTTIHPGAPAVDWSKPDKHWVLQTYLELAKRGNLNVECSTRPRLGRVNLIHSANLLEISLTPDQFVVCIQADYPRRGWAHYHLVQNELLEDDGASMVYMWPLPNLVPRDPDRTGVETVAFAGELTNLALSVEWWKRAFARIGIRFTILGPDNYHDVHDIDVLIAVRSFDGRLYPRKPANKLFNAWMAHIPLIASPDSAFRQVGQPGTDYLIAHTPSDVINHVQQLRGDRSMYQTIVRNGVRKASFYTRDRIADRWENILQGPVQQRYQQWRSKPISERVSWYARRITGQAKIDLKLAIRNLVGNEKYKTITDPLKRVAESLKYPDPNLP